MESFKLDTMPEFKPMIFKYFFFFFVASTNSWIGFHCLANKFLFEWDSGLSVTYTNWAKREPNGARSNEDCTYAYAGVSVHSMTM